MKTINQKKIDKATQLILLVGLDFIASYLLIQLGISISKGNFTKHTLVLLLFSIGFTPFAVVQHLKNVPKYIETKLTCLMLFMNTAVLAWQLFTDLFRYGFSDPLDGIFCLGTGLILAITAILILVKIFSKVVDSEEKLKLQVDK